MPLEAPSATEAICLLVTFLRLAVSVTPLMSSWRSAGVSPVMVGSTSIWKVAGAVPGTRDPSGPDSSFHSTTMSSPSSTDSGAETVRKTSSSIVKGTAESTTETRLGRPRGDSRTEKVSSGSPTPSARTRSACVTVSLFISAGIVPARPLSPPPPSKVASVGRSAAVALPVASASKAKTSWTGIGTAVVVATLPLVGLKPESNSTPTARGPPSRRLAVGGTIRRRTSSVSSMLTVRSSVPDTLS